MSLTHTAIGAAKAHAKAVKLFDGGGLYLEVSPGGGKWWRWKYRYGGKEKRLSLGVYPQVSLKAARDERDAVRQQLASGHARNAEKLVQAGAGGFAALAREWHTKFSAGWAQSHSHGIIRRLERNVFPWLGPRPIADIKAPELLAVLRRIESRGRWKPRTARCRTARRCFATPW